MRINSQGSLEENNAPIFNIKTNGKADKENAKVSARRPLSGISNTLSPAHAMMYNRSMMNTYAGELGYS